MGAGQLKGLPFLLAVSVPIESCHRLSVELKKITKSNPESECGLGLTVCRVKITVTLLFGYSILERGELSLFREEMKGPNQFRSFRSFFRLESSLVFTCYRTEEQSLTSFGGKEKKCRN